MQEALRSVVIGYVVGSAGRHPSPRLQELARARARAHLDRTWTA